MSFAKNMGKNIGINIMKHLGGKYTPGMLAMRQKLFDRAKQPATDAFNTASKSVSQKTIEATGDLIGNEIAYKIIKA